MGDSHVEKSSTLTHSEYGHSRLLTEQLSPKTSLLAYDEHEHLSSLESVVALELKSWALWLMKNMGVQHLLTEWLSREKVLPLGQR